jgi:pre-mRNA-splicing factor RBM22/SLT11
MFQSERPCCNKAAEKDWWNAFSCVPGGHNLRTLYLGGLDDRASQDDLKNQFYGYGEIESSQTVPQCACAFATYTSQEGSEKVADNLANKLVIKDLRL